MKLATTTFFGRTATLARPGSYTSSWWGRFYAAGALLGLAACSPGYGGSDLEEKRENLTRSVVPSDFENAGVIGQGRDMVTEELRGDCVSSARTVNIPLQESSLRFDASLLKEEASEMLGFSVDAKARYKLVSGSARARFSRSLTNNSLSLGLFYVADYKMGVERLDQANLQWSVQPGDPDWIGRCGDQFLQQRERGGQLFLQYRIDFASAEAKQEFEASVGVSFTAGAVNVAVTRAASRFSSRATVHVEAFQSGGDVTRLSSILGGNGPDANGGRTIIECSMTNLAPCGQFMQNAITYASAQTASSFSETLRTNPADRTYLFKDWGVLGVDIPMRRVPTSVLATRETLRQLFDGQVEFADRVALLRSGRIFVQPELRGQLNGYARRVQQNIAALTDGASYCYDELVDPADSVLVDECTRTVDHLDANRYDHSLTMDKLTVPPCEVKSVYTVTKDCGNDGLYAGPNRPDLHGGVCLFTNANCHLRSTYTENKSCGSGWVYAGPNRPDLHGGVCLHELSGRVSRTSYTTTKSCDYHGAYVGPNRPDLHGGYCVYIE